MKNPVTFISFESIKAPNLGRKSDLLKTFFSPEQPKCSILEGEEDYCARIFECVDFVGATGPDTYTQMLELRNHLLMPRLFYHFSTHSLVIFDTHFRPNFAATFSTFRKMVFSCHMQRKPDSFFSTSSELLPVCAHFCRMTHDQ